MIWSSGVPKAEGAVMGMSSLMYGFISCCFIRGTKAKAGHYLFGNKE
jgi:hypothetical protein